MEPGCCPPKPPPPCVMQDSGTITLDVPCRKCPSEQRDAGQSGSCVDHAPAKIAKVLITAADGYVAGHLVQQLQEAGHQVRGTVRSIQDAERTKCLYNLSPCATYKLELMQADHKNPESFIKAAEGRKYVLHVICPYSVVPQHKGDDEMVKMVVDSTLQILNTCAVVPSVQRAVFIGSCNACGWEVRKPGQSRRTESDWSDLSKIDVYSKCMTLAEKTAWDFVRDRPDHEKFDLIFVNPSLVLGPPLHCIEVFEVETMLRLLKGHGAKLPRLNFSIVDVRDLAKASIKAMFLPEAAGQRFICSNTNMWYTQIGQLVKSVFGPQGYNVPTAESPKLLLTILSLFDEDLKAIVPHLGDVKIFCNDKMREVLEVEPREIRDTIIDMAYALIEIGAVRKSPSYNGPGGPEEREQYLNVRLF